MVSFELQRGEIEVNLILGGCHVWKLDDDMITLQAMVTAIILKSPPTFNVWQPVFLLVRGYISIHHISQGYYIGHLLKYFIPLSSSICHLMFFSEVLLSSLLILLPVVHIQNYIRNSMLLKRRAKTHFYNSIICFLASV